ncbi:thymidylate synthase [Acanthamoeba castellanii str. Neff]|uniref:thymidylate synthase n=1 Tax=Acanthamoeba castellanii (strain ATCC 30010 / Neff) TaxID=1257118 RepID=L8H0B2_ACACF|nr:thymidylate synthase [Acanthamoeba castellanii str. Neff]ELR18203.1 thymidylate synthase [Acanthamoeba castellanii str. Neff]
MQSQHEGESAYLALASYILKYGQERSDERTGDDTISVFAPPSIRFDNVGERFPLLTTKRVFWRGVLEELLWFLRGSTDSKELEAKKVNIWRDNTTRKFLDDRGLHHLPEGDIGRQTREENGIDQMAEAIRLIIEDPGSRRNIVSAWNVSDLNKMALPPCHNFMQFNVSPDHTTVNLLVNMRSVDPFNIASYAALLCLIARITDKNPGSLIFTMGDAHIYKNHVDGMKEQISRTPYDPPRLVIGRKPTLDDLHTEDFVLTGYYPQPTIKFRMAI